MSDRVELVRQAYATASKAGYLETDWGWFFDQVATDDLEFDASRTYPDIDALFRGRDGFIAFWRTFAEAWKTWTIVADDIYEPREGLVVALMRVVAEGHESGITSDRKEAHVWWFRDDRVCRIEAWPDRQEAYRELGLEPR